jgi:hypothetical protein
MEATLLGVWVGGNSSSRRIDPDKQRNFIPIIEGKATSRLCKSFFFFICYLSFALFAFFLFSVVGDSELERLHI